MRQGQERKLFLLHARSLLSRPSWWGRLMLCVTVASFVLLVAGDTEQPWFLGPVSVFGPVFLVLLALLLGPPAARPRIDAFELSRPGGRSDLVNRRMLLITAVALCCCLLLGSIAFAATPELFRDREVEMDFWFMADFDPFIGAEVSFESEEERICFEKWNALRRGGTHECNRRAREVFSGGSGDFHHYIFASVEERECLAQWAEHESGKAYFAGIFAEKPWERPDDERNWVVTGVSKYFFHGDDWSKAALEASTDATCTAFAHEFAGDSDPFEVLVADDQAVQPCFAHWQESLGRGSTCWRPHAVVATFPPIGCVLLACFGLALVAGAMLRTALAPAGPGRLLTLAGTGLVLAAPVVSLFGAVRMDQSWLLACAAMLAVGAYVAARARWAKGDFQ